MKGKSFLRSAISFSSLFTNILFDTSCFTVSCSSGVVYDMRRLGRMNSGSLCEVSEFSCFSCSLSTRQDWSSSTTATQLIMIQKLIIPPFLLSFVLPSLLKSGENSKELNWVKFEPFKSCLNLMEKSVSKVGWFNGNLGSSSCRAESWKKWWMVLYYYLPLSLSLFSLTWKKQGWGKTIIHQEF